MSEVLHKGGCHCGNVEFQVFAPSILDCVSCNCSICEKKQNVHFIVPKKKFRLICGEEFLTTYTFNTHQAKHIFCKVCGVQSFYTPRSNPDGVGVMPHCLEKETIKSINMKYFDGANWEESIKSKLGSEIQDQSKEL